MPLPNWYQAILCVIVLQTHASSQTLPLKTLTVESGLISDAVTTLFQESSGYLWIGTGDGISIFDGYSMRHLTVADGLALNHISSVTESRNERGTMILGTWGGGITLLKGATCMTLLPDSSVEGRIILGAVEDQRGTIWCVTQAGAFRSTPEGFVRVPHAQTARQILITRDSSIVLALQGALLEYGPGSNEEVKRISIPGTAGPTHLYQDRYNNIWLATADSQLTKIVDGEPVARYRVPFASVTGIADDEDGNLWLGTGDGLVLFSPRSSSFTRFSRENGLRANLITACLTDHEGSLWIGNNDAGLQQLADRHVYSFPISGIPESYNNTKAVTDLRGHVWAISDEGLQEIWKDESGTWRRHLHRLPITQRHSMPTVCKDHLSRLWIDTGRRIECYEIVSGSGGPSRLSTVAKLEPGRHIPDGPRFFFTVDTQSNLWISMLGQGVYRVPFRGESGEVTLFSTANGLPTNDIRAMSEDRTGHMWLGTVDKGIVLVPISGSTVARHYTEKEGLAENLIRAIAEDSQGRVWVGTRRDGLSVINAGTITHISVEQGLYGASVWALAVDVERAIILAGTSQGVHPIDMATLRPVGTGNLARGKVVSAVGTHRGRFLWFSTKDALTVHEYKGGIPVSSPLMQITKVTVNGEPGEKDRSVEYHYNENHFSFEYVGITFRESGELRYRYRLDGAEQDWLPPTKERSVTYASLAPGRYTFQVQALDPGGTTLGGPATFSFTIVPPLWNRWWFILAAVFVTLGSAGFIVRSRVNRALEIERLRSRIARDLHDEIGSNLSSIAMASDLLKRQEGLGEKERGKLSDISSVALNTVKDMKDIVWLIKPGNDSLDDLFLRMKDTAAILLDGCHYRLGFPDESIGKKVNLEWRQHVYLIFKEALTNIAKHASATSVSIGVAVDGDNLAITIEDDGRGFDPASATRGSGLKNMHDRAEILKAQFSVSSTSSGGTRVRLKTRIASVR